MTIRIDVATMDDLEAVVAAANALVAADAGRYDPLGTDLGWAARSGVGYATGLLAGAGNLVLLARDGDGVVGHLVGRVSGPGGIRSVRTAELESIHVRGRLRGAGIGHELMERFLAWATEQRADRVAVTTYAANDGAQRFYARYGFVPMSVTLHRDV